MPVSKNSNAFYHPNESIYFGKTVTTMKTYCMEIPANAESAKSIGLFYSAKEVDRGLKRLEYKIKFELAFVELGISVGTDNSDFYSIKQNAFVPMYPLEEKNRKTESYYIEIPITAHSFNKPGLVLRVTRLGEDQEETAIGPLFLHAIIIDWQTRE